MKKNLVLIGMPGCGKTRVGQALSGLLAMPLVDTDQMVEETVGRTIPDIFAWDGEPAFRDLETAAARRAAALEGAVIATGGGIVLRPENMEALSANGVIFFRNRDLAAILGEDHSGRPLIGQDRDRVYRLYEQRFPLYRQYADYIISHTDSVAEAAQLIATIYLEECEP